MGKSMQQRSGQCLNHKRTHLQSIVAMSEDQSKLLVRVDVPDIKTQVGTHAYVREQQRVCGVFTGYPVVYVAALKIAACIMYFTK